MLQHAASVVSEIAVKLITMMFNIVVTLCLIGSVAVSAFRSPAQIKLSLSSLFAQKEELDSQGYIIKPRDWFNGLSSDPGASLTDPRAVPPAMKAFAEKIKAGGDVESFAETIRLIDENYDYFAVPFQVGDLKSAANENKVRVLMYCLLETCPSSPSLTRLTFT